MFETKKEDWYFIIISYLIFFLSLIVSILDFILIQKMNFGVMNVLGLILFLIGLTIRLSGKRTLGKYYSYGLETSPDHELIQKGFYKYIRHPIYLAVIIYGLGVP
ncbi:MAG: isoprenylcysteine carboxylmethyltransferase family protein, partial [Methanobacteriaceae archaeon]|nr:isoprenylcysteine carboxylmethyltransferase family protein [Methanobacteriaceae archaeon]